FAIGPAAQDAKQFDGGGEEDEVGAAFDTGGGEGEGLVVPPACAGARLRHAAHLPPGGEFAQVAVAVVVEGENDQRGGFFGVALRRGEGGRQGVAEFDSQD